MSNRLMVLGTTVAMTLCCAAGMASAQSSNRGAEKVVTVSTAPPQFVTLRKMHKPISVAFSENKLEDVMKYIADATGAELEVLWADDRDGEGLNKETVITLEVKNVPAITLLEKVLDKAAAAESVTAGSNSWQMTELGPMQIGPKSRLNKYKRVEIYPIDDLLLEVPNFTEAPEFNLQTVLQSAQGGGGQSPFQDTGGKQEQDKPTRQQKTDDLVSVITTLVETEQWVENGGDGASIRSFQGALLVNGPDYIHRQLGGYPYWPSKIGGTSGRNRRWLGMTGSTSSSQIDEIKNVPVTEPK